MTTQLRMYMGVSSIPGNIFLGKKWHLVQIQLLPAEQNSGYGTQVLRSVIEKANAAGMLLKLSVLKVNPAKHLYERLGFTVQSESEHSYRMALQPSGVGRCEVSGGEER